MPPTPSPAVLSKCQAPADIGTDLPPERVGPSRCNNCWDGAGEGNRTLVFSLEGCCSTIELHPRQGLPNTAGRRSQLPRISGPTQDQLPKINCPRDVFPAPSRPCEQPLVPPGPPPLNNSGIAAYIDVF